MSWIGITEFINVHNAKYLLSLPANTFKDTVWSGDYMDGQDKLDKEVYCDMVKVFLKKSIHMEGKLTHNYKFSKRMKTFGRQWSEQFSVQSLKKNLRGFLTYDTDSDFDMVNCHPALLRYITKKYYGGHEFPMINQYVMDRAETLKLMDTDKQSVLIAMNSDKSMLSDNLHFLRLDREFKRIQQLLFVKTPEDFIIYNGLKESNGKNKKGSFLNSIMCTIENECITRIVDHFGIDNVHTPMFDGLHMPISMDIEQTLAEFNKLTKDFCVEWAHKPHDRSIVIDKSVKIKDFESKAYADVKARLEEHVAIIKVPLCFIYEDINDEGKLTYSVHTKDEMKTIVAPMKYESVNSGKLVEKSIFNDWIEDPDRREYKRMDFVPNENYNNPDVYNTFKGFDYSNYDTTEFEYKQQAVDLFTHQISILCNHEIESVEYNLNYIADMFQNPAILPAVSLLFKSGMGWGKDQMIDAIQKLMGAGFVHRTADMDSIFGNFNGSLKNKMILQFNEQQGRAGFANKEKLKNIITEKYTTINEKNEKAYTQTNYLRIYICTNNEHVIDIPVDDRRFCVFKADKEKPPVSHCLAMLDMIEDRDSMFTLFKFFMERNLLGVSLRNDRPKTSAYNDMKTWSVNPFYVFLSELFIDKQFEDYFEGNYKQTKTREYVVSTTTFKNIYVQQTQCSDITSKTIVKLMHSVGCITKKVRLSGQSLQSFVINPDDLIPQLQLMNLDQSGNELNENDFIN